MSIKIYAKPDIIWKFFEKNKAKLKKDTAVVAENLQTDYKICLTESDDEPLLLVYKNSNEEYRKYIKSQEECLDVAKKIYAKYLFPVDENGKITSSEDDESPEETLQDMEDMQYEREDELKLALIDFLNVIYQTSLYDDDDDTVIYDILDSLLRCLSEEYAEMGPIYYPQIFIDEKSGERQLVEYPYDCQ